VCVATPLCSENAWTPLGALCGVTSYRCCVRLWDAQMGNFSDYNPLGDLPPCACANVVACRKSKVWPVVMAMRSTVYGTTGQPCPPKVPVMITLSRVPPTTLTFPGLLKIQVWSPQWNCETGCANGLSGPLGPSRADPVPPNNGRT